MKNVRFLKIALIAFIFLPLVGCEEEEFVTGTMRDEFVTIPFKGNFQINASLSGQKDEAMYFEVRGEGLADVFGESLMFFNTEIQLNYENPDWNQVGDLVFIAGMGDEVIGNFTGLFRLAYGEEVGHGSGRFAFTEGTGRYEGITGGGTYTLTMNENQMGTMEWIGTITVRKSILSNSELNAGVY